MNNICPRCGCLVEVLHDYNDEWEGGAVRCNGCRNLVEFASGDAAKALATVLSGAPRVTTYVDGDMAPCVAKFHVNIIVNGFEHGLSEFGSYETVDKLNPGVDGCTNVNFTPINVTPDHLLSIDLTIDEFDLVVAQLREYNVARCNKCTATNP